MKRDQIYGYCKEISRSKFYIFRIYARSSEGLPFTLSILVVVVVRRYMGLGTGWTEFRACVDKRQAVWTEKVIIESDRK